MIELLHNLSGVALKTIVIQIVNHVVLKKKTSHNKLSVVLIELSSQGET